MAVLRHTHITFKYTMLVMSPLVATPLLPPQFLGSEAQGGQERMPRG